MKNGGEGDRARLPLPRGWKRRGGCPSNRHQLTTQPDRRHLHLMTETKTAAKPVEKITRTDAEWRAQLTGEQYKVARQHGTERAFSGIYADHHADGVYICVGCGAPMFDSKTKFDSGTGWPSFWQPAEGGMVE